MNSNKSQARIWRRTAVALAASTVVLAQFGLNAYAQTNVTGSVFGTVQSGPGVTVVVENVETGLKRTLVPDAAGKFNAPALPTGNYRATVLRDGKVVGASPTFEVKIGQGSEVQFAAQGGVQTVEITGRVLRLDVTSSNSGATFSSKQLDSIPVARNLDGIIQLAPNTTRADPRYTGGASIGGGAPSENSYYINGFPVTNALNQLGSSELPFGAIGQAQILTGGFGAEFGRSIGGVVNIITKSGTNTWEGGVSASVTPSSLRSSYKDILYPDTGYSGNAATDGTLYRRRSNRTVTETSLGGYVGGPLVKDKLFMFTAVERVKSKDSLMALPTSSFGSATSVAPFYSNAGWAERTNTTDRYLVKFDWSITKDNLLELTLLGDKSAQDETISGYNWKTDTRDGVVAQTARYVNNDAHTPGVGADARILRYTGYLTPDFTLTALIGKSTSEHTNVYGGVDVFSSLRQVRADPSTQYPGFTYKLPYPFAGGTTVLAPGSKDETTATRLDLEYVLGAHTLRGGIDRVKLKSISAGEVTAGGGLYRYFRTANAGLKPNGATTSVSSGNALTAVVGAACVTATNPTGTCYYYGYEQIFTTTTNAQSNQSATYLEDKWQLNKDMVFTPGLRVEQYENLNGDGQVFLKVKTQIHPRLAFAWDVLSDKSTKLFATAGRYGVQIPTHLAVRGASRSTFTRQPFTYTGVDPVTGAPLGRNNIGQPFSTNNEYGQAKDAKTVAAQDMKPNSQDELRIGIERALTPKWNVGAILTYRALAATIDDLCDPRPFEKYAVDKGIDISNWGGFGCASFNPGMANKFLIDYSGTGNYTTVNLSKADLQFEKAKRTYMALDLSAEHPLSDGWYGKVTYTYSKSKGNTEGQTLSDVGQTDVAATQTWDTPELMVGAYGYLPNDRRHQIKAYGFMRVTSEIDVGGNLLLASGRPKNCIGNYGGTPFSFPGAGTTFDDVDYGAAFRYCTTNGVTSFLPRGTQGYLPWDVRFDANVIYKPTWAKGLAVRADVRNLLNRQTVEAIDEIHEVSYDPGTITPTYGRVLSYTAPRSVKFTVTYDAKF